MDTSDDDPETSDLSAADARARPGNLGPAMRRLYSLQEPGESDAAFSRRLGLQPQTLSNYKNGHHELSLRTALKVHRTIGLSLDWLITGRGARYVEASGDPARPGRSPAPARGSHEGDRPDLVDAARRFLEASSHAEGLADGDGRALEAIRDRLRDLISELD